MMVAIPGQDRIRAMAQHLHHLSRSVAGNPVRGARGNVVFAARRSNAAIERQAGFHGDERAPRSDKLCECLIDATSRCFFHSDGQRDACCLQPVKTASAYLRVGIARRRHHPSYARRNQRVRAGTSPAVMAAGFQSDVHGRAARLLAGLL